MAVAPRIVHVRPAAHRRVATRATQPAFDGSTGFRGGELALKEWTAAAPPPTLPPLESEALLEEVPASAAEEEASAVAERVRDRKAALLRTVAGLDRGVAATPLDVVAVDAAATALEEAAGAEVPLVGAALEEALRGKWRLVWSSTFAGRPGGSQGFTGSPTGATPLKLGAVYQRILGGTLDNIVELSLPLPWPLETVRGSATLSHTLETEPDGTRTSIRFTEVSLRTRGIPGVQPLKLPGPGELDLEPLERVQRAAGTFDTTFVDDDLRLSRTELGELRVFVREQ